MSDEGDDDGTTTDWRDSLPEGLADASFIKAAESPEDAITAINNAAQHMGQSIRIPGDDAGDDDTASFISKIMEKAPNLMVKPDLTDAGAMEQFYRTAGKPEKAEDYLYKPPEGKEIPGDFEAFSSVAHKFGLSQKQFEGILGGVLGPQWESVEANELTQKNEMKELNKEWGVAYDQNLGTVKNFLRLTDAPEGIVELIVEGAMSTKEIKWLHEIATQTKAPLELVTQQQDANIITPDEAQNRIQEMMHNNDHPYWNSADPRHAGAVQKMLELQALAHPGAATDPALMRG